jgi:BirA family biotin operon repressor/biotin-[acetyl-CoA-carboxylase] ligase
VVPSSPYDDLDRPPLRSRALQRALAPEGWRVEVVDSAGSTNALVVERARRGEPAGLVLVTEHQTAGRGRLDRTWTSPPRAGLTFSVLQRPAWPMAQWGWLPLLTGLSVATALREQAEVQAVVKWPNDVLVEGRKVCGVLAEVADAQSVVLGIGLNVTTRPHELPHEAATSLRIEGASTTDRDTLLRAVLRALEDAYTAPEAARDRYRALCSTIGRTVRVELPGREPVQGKAQAVDDAGQLVVDGTRFGAGDVVHVRATD